LSRSSSADLHSPGRDCIEATESDIRCALCSYPALDVLFHLRNSPFVQNKLLRTAEDAIAVDRIDVAYHYCGRCHFAFNPTFNPSRVNYREYYNKQTESLTYRRQLDALAERLAVDCGLGPQSTIVEIGSGNGYFLSRLKEITGSRSLHGFDPAYRGDYGVEAHVRRQFFAADEIGPKVDLVVFRHCLEALIETQPAMKLLRSLGETSRVYAEITDLDYVMGERNPSMLYYEYYRYFSARSIDIFLRRQGYRVQQLLPLLGGSALGVTATRAPANGALRGAYKELETLVRQHQRVVAWGISGRTISLLSHMSWDQNVVAHGVDIDPARQGMFIPVTGQRILSPADAKTFRPDLVIVANPVYAEEIRQVLGSSARLVNLHGKFI
jgi:hypothetical protein